MISALRLKLLASILVVASTATAATPSENWEKHCAGCHGADGKAQTRIGRKAGAKDLTDKANQSKITDADIMKLVKGGRVSAKGEEKMEAFSDRLSDTEITALIQIVRNFAK
jgi:mono/diheme cytochrome c family protein